MPLPLPVRGAPRLATRPKNRWFPLSVMAVGAALPDHVSWEIVDGNKPESDPLAEIAAIVEHQRGSDDPWAWWHSP